jgi:hypothetical protein
MVKIRTKTTNPLGTVQRYWLISQHIHIVGCLDSEGRELVFPRIKHTCAARNFNGSSMSNDGGVHRAVAAEKRGQKRAMHPSNKYAEKAPDFGLLASKDPSFQEYVTHGPNRRPRIDWTDFNATRELTRALLEHDYGIKW